MIRILCQDCALCLRVLGSPEEIDLLVGESSEFWPDSYYCPECEKRVTGHRELDVDPQIDLVVRTVNLTPQEAFTALNGFGLPDEGLSTLSNVVELFQSKKVKGVTGRNVYGTTRCIVTALTFEDGTRLHLAAGAEGACAYRISKPSSCVEKLDGR